MDLKIIDIDFNKEWMDRRESLVKYALLSLEDKRQEQIKARRNKINGIYLIAAIVIVAFVLVVLAILSSNILALTAIITFAVIFIFFVHCLMIDYVVLNEIDRESSFKEISDDLNELLTCTEIEKAYCGIKKLSDLISIKYEGWTWKTPEVSDLVNFLSSLWIGYCVFRNTVLECKISDKKYKQGIILTYADKNGDVYEEFYECKFRNNIKIDTDTLTWEKGKLVYIKKYKQEEI